MAIEEGKIFQWLEKVEGRLTNRGYIPCYVKANRAKKVNYFGAVTGKPEMYDPMGVSGVTVGVGVDLGQQTEHELRRWGVSEELLDKIRFYLGKADAAGAKALYERSLLLTIEEARALTTAEHHGYMIDVVQPQWNFRYSRKGRYEDLPWQAQCVVYSGVYQHGWNGYRKRAEHTLEALEAHDWARAVRNLRSGVKGWGADYWRRRKMEGDLLAELCS